MDHLSHLGEKNKKHNAMNRNKHSHRTKYHGEPETPGFFIMAGREEPGESCWRNLFISGDSGCKPSRY